MISLRLRSVEVFPVAFSNLGFLDSLMYNFLVLRITQGEMEKELDQLYLDNTNNILSD